LANLFGEKIGDAVVGFINAVLVRNARRRPDVKKVIGLFQQLRSVIHQLQVFVVFIEIYRF
jgi:hypothetical protein